jgi:hypothetical protein
VRQEIVEAPPALSRGNEATPLRDRELDRRQGSRGQDRAGDDDAGRGLLVDDQPGPDTEDARLQRHTQDLRQAAQSGGDIGRLLVNGKAAAIALTP